MAAASAILPDDCDEFQPIAQPCIDDLPHDSKVDNFVPVHEDVSKTYHVPETSRRILWDPCTPLEKIHKLAVRPWFAQAFIRDDVGSHIEQRLDGNLQRVLDEPLFADVGGDPFGD